MPWLINQSSLGADWQHGEAELPPPVELSFLMGNGQISASSHVSAQASSLRVKVLTAAEPKEARIECWFELQGEPLVLAEQRLRRTRDACFVLAEEIGCALRVVLLSFAPPEGQGLIRLVRVENSGSEDLVGLSLQAQASGEAELNLRLGASQRFSNRISSLPLRLSAGETRDFVLSITSPAGDEEWTSTVDLSGLRQLAHKTRLSWQQRLLASTQYDCDRRLIRDLIQDRKLDLMAMSGSFDATDVQGPTTQEPSRAAGLLLMQLRFGLWDDAAKGLAVDARDSAAAAWSILKHYWYWHASRDQALIRRRWHELESCLLILASKSQPAELASSTLNLLATTAAGRLAAACGSEQGKERSRVLLREAARLSARTEAQFWRNSEGRYAVRLGNRTAADPAALLPESFIGLWAGWTWSQGKRGAMNLRQAARAVWQLGDLSKMSPNSPTSAADLHAMLLVALSEFDASEESGCLEAILQRPELRNLESPYRTGLALDAVLYSLTGLRLTAVPGHAEDDLRIDPLLPANCRFLTVKAVAQGGRRFDLYLRREDEGITSFDLVLVDAGLASKDQVSVALRLHGDTHLGWLEDRPDYWDEEDTLRRPRIMSGLSQQQAGRESFLPSGYFR